MQLLSLGFTLAVLLTNVWGLTLATGWIWGHRWIALVAAPWICTTLFFLVECHWGLGRLQSLGALATLVSAGLIYMSGSVWKPAWCGGRIGDLLSAWRSEFAPRCLLGCGSVFVVGFAYVLAWRYAYPDIHAWIEKIPDFAYVAGYSSGERIPVTDVWLAPYASQHYYSFQHYAAALMGRLLGVSPGAAYNLGFSLMVAWIGAGFAAVLVRLTRSWWIRAALWIALLGGGSGVTLVVPLLLKNGLPWESTFLFGSVTMDEEPLGTALERYAQSFKRMNLPTEPLAYSIYLGDYHAPLASYALLGLAVAAALQWQATGRRREAGLIGATLTWTVLANLWSLPLQGLAILIWAGWHRREWRRWLPGLVLGAAAVWLASWGYLSEFVSEAVRQEAGFGWVAAGEHTPPWFFLIIHLPTLFLALAGIFSRHTVARRLGWLAFAFLALSEFVFVDDSYAGEHNRFNTVLKWWPWIATSTLLILGPIALSEPRRGWIRGIAFIACFAPCVYLWNLATYWWMGDRQSAGFLDGHHFMTKEPFVRLLLERLLREPRGVVIEDPRDDGSEGLASLPLHAGHLLWLGWEGYELLWRGFPEDVRLRKGRLMSFYDGSLPDAVEWLESEKIDYVLFYRSTDTGLRWAELDRQIGAAYTWCELLTENDRKIGFWRSARKDGLK